MHADNAKPRPTAPWACSCASCSPALGLISSEWPCSRCCASRNSARRAAARRFRSVADESGSIDSFTAGDAECCARSFIEITGAAISLGTEDPSRICDEVVVRAFEESGELDKELEAEGASFRQTPHSA